MIPVIDVMIRKVVKMKKTASIYQAACVMQDRNIGSVVVEDHKQIVGILTEGDIVRRVIASGVDPHATTTGEAMTVPFLVIEAERSVVDANDIMEREHVRHLGVIQNDKIVGIVSVRDLLSHLYGKSLHSSSRAV